MKKIIFISHDPLTDTIKKNFFLDRFREDGVHIEYWCVRHILKYANKSPLNNEISVPYFEEIRSEKVLLQLLEQRASDAWISVELWFNWDTVSIFKILKPYRARLFSIDWYGNMPAISVRRKIIDDLKAFNFVKLFQAGQRILSRKIFGVYSKLTGLQPSPLLFIAGNKQISDANRTVVSLNHHDFDMFLEHTPQDSTIVENKYAVFLDVMLPYHPDFERLGSKALSADVYYSKLNTFFDRVETNLGIPVVIAAHPKSAYKKEFGSRQVIKGKTTSLVAGSSVVFTHHSVSMFYAVLFRKQIVLLTMNEFIHAGAKNFAMQVIHYQMERYVTELGCTLINVDEPATLDFDAVNPAVYEKFERTFIRGNSDKPNYNVIKETLRLL
ncbi:hypothetical protein [Chitinophaga agri]|uniref:Uncharacterized protein n=1 Tax=Chitinophaga agri TaxID=2703787 RepID=A0A6B9ZIW1_9BACT|nr:hypothetical protein [Chitinophaga agri]QHS61996.1 hypothetical protein GWR21_21025 [Chitinophaga agri]